MSIYLIPSKGQSTYGIGICDRCRMKRFIDDLVQDPNYPGLRVCDPGKIGDGCKDHFDPWRLPARQTEKIVLPFNRPDVILSDTPIDIYGNEAPYDYTVDKYGSIQPPTINDRATMYARALTALSPVPPHPRYFIVDSQGNVIMITPFPGTAQ